MCEDKSNMMGWELRCEMFFAAIFSRMFSVREIDRVFYR